MMRAVAARSSSASSPWRRARRPSPATDSSSPSSSSSPALAAPHRRWIFSETSAFLESFAGAAAAVSRSSLNADGSGAEFGSVRRAWRPLVARLAWFPPLQRAALEAAAFFTQPRELDFRLPRDFHDRFALGDKLGEGAFGQVFRVLPLLPPVLDGELAHVPLDLAVKVVPKARVVSLRDFQALQQEARMMILLGGTLNVVHFFGAFEDDESVYLVMEHCVGGDAAARLTPDVSEVAASAASAASAAALDVSEREKRVRMYMADILHVVWQCHLLRIVHGDLKLENFLFADERDDSPLKLTDFGGAAFVPAVADDGNAKEKLLHEVRGTPLYTAPEVLRRSYSFPSDLWSCGVIMYRLLSGRFPFESGPLLDERILHEQIDFESPPWTDISEEAKDLTRRLLERDVTHRLTAEQALQHPWMASNAAANDLNGKKRDAASASAASAMPPALQCTLVQRLQLYRTLNGLQQAVLAQVARDLPLEAKQDVVVLYSEVARDASALLGITQLAEYVASSGYKLTAGEVRSFLRGMDLDGDGFLAVDEFCAALLDWAAIQSGAYQKEFNACVARVFAQLDADGDGSVSLEDLQLRLSPFSSAASPRDGIASAVPVAARPPVVRSFRYDLARSFRSADRDGDGLLDANDFARVLLIPKNAYSHFATRLRW